MEDFEKKYKDAMARLELVIRTGLKLDPTYIFPELKESEEERIRTLLISSVKNETPIASEHNKKLAIAWLKKQHTDPYNGVGFDCYGHHWGMCARDYGVEIIFDGELKAFLSPEKSFIYPIHPQPDITSKSTMEEKPDDQNCGNPADIGEPKFKVGDWVVLYPSEIEVNRKVVQISRIERCQLNMYWTTEDTWFGDGTDAKLWSIEDAKDGDVLTGSHGTFIFMGESNGGYCGVLSDNTFIRSTGNNEWTEDLHPATKEQRDTLMKAMADAGWTFDFEKKEVKKIEFNPDDLIEESYQQQADDLINAVTEKPNWSKEDDIHLRDALYAAENIYTDKCGKEELVDWLKSLKNRLKGE